MLLISLNHFFFFRFLRVCSGVKLTLSALVDGKNINGGGHKVNIGLVEAV